MDIPDKSDKTAEVVQENVEKAKGAFTRFVNALSSVIGINDVWAEVTNRCPKDDSNGEAPKADWSCITDDGVYTMKVQSYILIVLVLINILLGLMLVIMMIVDIIKNSSKAYSLNKDDPGYKTVIGIGTTASTFSFLNVSNYFKGYPFILLQLLSLVIILLSGIVFGRTMLLTNATKVKLFYGLIFLYCLISGVLNIAYSVTKMKNARKEEYVKYQEFNESLRDYIHKDAVFISALSSPSSTNRNDNIIAALRKLGNDPLDSDALSNVLVSLAMYTYYDDLNDENDREKSLITLFDNVKYIQSVLPDLEDPSKYMNPPLEYTKYLYRKRIAIDDSTLQSYITAAQSASPPVPVIANSNQCVLNQARTLAVEKINRLNNTYLSFFPQEVFLTMRTMVSTIFMAQLAIPVICYMLWRRYGKSIAPQ